MPRPRLPIEYKLDAARVFLSLHRLARQTQQRQTVNTPEQFAYWFIQALHSSGICVEPVAPNSLCWLIDQVVWLEIISLDSDPALARQHLRATMHQQPVALVGYLVQIDEPLHWSRVQISETWLSSLRMPPVATDETSQTQSSAPSSPTELIAEIVKINFAPNKPIS